MIRIVAILASFLYLGSTAIQGVADNRPNAETPILPPGTLCQNNHKRPSGSIQTEADLARVPSRGRIMRPRPTTTRVCHRCGARLEN